MTLTDAITIAQAAVDAGRAKGLDPLAVAVLDRGGHPLALLRDERAGTSRAEIAVAKAAGCLSLGLGGGAIAKRAARAPQLYAHFGQIFPKGLIPARGGVLIRDREGALLGAIGVSGDTADNDEQCALAGVAAVQLAGEVGE